MEFNLPCKLRVNEIQNRKRGTIKNNNDYRQRGWPGTTKPLTGNTESDFVFLSLSLSLSSDSLYTLTFSPTVLISFSVCTVQATKILGLIALRFR